MVVKIVRALEAHGVGYVRDLACGSSHFQPRHGNRLEQGKACRTVAPRRNAATFVEYDKLLPVMDAGVKVCIGFDLLFISKFILLYKKLGLVTYTLVESQLPANQAH